MKKLASLTSSMAVSLTLTSASTIFILALTARVLGPAEFGLFTAAIMGSSALGQLSLFGVQRSVMRDLLATSSTPSEGGVVSMSDDLVWATASGQRLAYAASLLLTVLLLLTDLTSWDRWQFAIGCGLLAAAASQQAVASGVLRGLGRSHTANLFEGRTGGPVTAIPQVLVVLVMAQSGHVSLGSMTLAMGLVASAVSCPVSWTLSRSRANMAALRARTRRPTGAVMHFLRVQGPFFLGQFASHASLVAPLMVAQYALVPNEASQFAAIQRVALVALIPTVVLQAVISPSIVAAAKEGRAVLLKLTTRMTLLLALVGGLPLVVATLHAEGVLTLFFGPDYAGAASGLRLMTVWAVLLIGIATVQSTLTLTGGETVTSKWMLFSIAAGTLASVVGALQWGLSGYVVGVILGGAIALIGLGFALSHHSPMFAKPLNLPT